MDKEPKKPVEQPDNLKTFKAWQFAWELGYTIAVPIVTLTLIGRFADKYLNTSPLLLLIGVAISVFLSTWLIYKKTKQFL